MRYYGGCIILNHTCSIHYQTLSFPQWPGYSRPVEPVLTAAGYDLKEVIRQIEVRHSKRQAAIDSAHRQQKINK
jgi:hypothetical protein